MEHGKHEADRLALIRSLDLLALQGTPDLDRITQLAAQTLGAPMGLITVIEEFEQRFISTVGTDLKATEREISVCAVAIEHDGVFEVEDLSQDPRFSDFRTVTEDGMRFYAGAPLSLSTGVKVGTLCVVGFEPRRLDAAERATLRMFGDLAMNQIQLLRLVGRRDAVTGLPNRQQLGADLATLQRENRLSQPRQLVLVDVLGEEATGRLAQALGLGPTESMARQLGYRIVDLLPGGTTLYHVGALRFAFHVRDHPGDGLPALLSAIRNRVITPVNTCGLDVSASFHAGIAPFDGSDFEDVMRRAVTALQGALEHGVAWRHYDRERDLKLRRQHMLALQVDAALRDNAFFLVYQPRLDIATGDVLSVEALLRWHHPELGPIAPGEFLPIIERTTLMPRVTQWVIQQALRQITQWDAAGRRIDLSINLSGADLEDGRIAERAYALTEQYGIEPGRIEFEITEGQWLQGEQAISQLRTLRTLGFSLALDDFGSGYSNFAYLNALPATTIKIDRSLIDGMEADGRRARLVRTLVMLASELGLRVVGEGVETDAQLELLRRWHCHEAQGYLISRPCSAQELQAFLLEVQSVPAGAS
ncbi:MAG: EAL domain-containing protein [Luteimonas sp.]